MFRSNQSFMNNNSAPLVSVCIPCYKHAELLKRCVQSVLSQSYSNFEIIITDDSPSNEIKDLVNSRFEDCRVRYIKNPEALGSPGNWNAGLEQAKGEYIKIMHHDDWFATKDSLERFVNTALATGSDFVCSNCYNVGPTVSKKHSILNRFRYKWARDKKLILFANYVGNPSTIFYKRIGNESLYFDTKSVWFVDVLFYYEFMNRSPKIAYINQYLLNTAAGMASQVTNSMIDAKVVLKEFLYVSHKHDLNKDHSFLTRLTLFEIMKRYKIRSRRELEDILGEAYDYYLPYGLLKLPIHYQIFNAFKHFLILV